MMSLRPQNANGPKITEDSWTCARCSLINGRERPGCAVCGYERPEEARPVSEQSQGKKDFKITSSTWTCRMCTLINRRDRPGCDACGTERPVEAIPDRGFEKVSVMDAQKIITPDKKFECPICFGDVESGEGVRLRECLCEICQECVRGAICHTTDGRAVCPNCRIEVCDRDIKNLVSSAEWDKHTARILKNAEAQVGSTAHCLTPDCPGWAEVVALQMGPDGKDCPFFMCPCCCHVNCVACKAQHEGKTCDEHREEITKKIKIDNKISEDYLENLVKNGEALRCPDCGAIVIRIRGCGYLVCGNPACKLPLCWWTKGRRWGPKGRGDTSDGCRCKVDGKKCHPECWWCDS